MKKLIWLIIIIAILGLIWWWASGEAALTPEPPVNSELTDDATIYGSEQGEVDTTSWKTYRNEEYGVEVKYPSGYSYEFNDNVDGRVVVYFLEDGFDFQVPISLTFEKVSLTGQGQPETLDEWVESWYCSTGCVAKLQGETSNVDEVYKYKATPEIGERLGYAFRGHEIYLMLDTIDQDQKAQVLDQMADSLSYPVSVRVR